MKPHAILVNTARGAVVDADALAEALQSKCVAAAGIDVLPTEPPAETMPLVRLWREDRDPPVNLVITPHCAFYSEESMVEMRIKAAQEVARVLKGDPPRSCVNAEYLERPNT
jgi:phosphoglycerate dehydrogenase-like enzyme